jgi:hypothetical protein
MKFDGSNYALPYLAWVVEAMVCLMRGRTAFMIAHRLETPANPDAQLMTEDRRVIRFEHRGVPAVGEVRSEPGSLRTGQPQERQEPI